MDVWRDIALDGLKYALRKTVRGLVIGVPILAVLILVGYYFLFPYRERNASFTNLPGPAPLSAVWGNVKEIIEKPAAEVNFRWIREFGQTFRVRALLGSQRVITVDPAALAFIVQHSDDFVKPVRNSQALAELLGDGVLTAEGAHHRRQRRVLNPAFSPASIRDMVSIMWDKAEEMRLKVTSIIEDDAVAEQEVPSPTPPAPQDIVPGARKIDIVKYLSKYTLDVIGTAGFGYEFNSFGDTPAPLADSFNDMIREGQKVTLWRILQTIFPVLRVFQNEHNRRVAHSRNMCVSIGREIVERQKSAIEAEKSIGYEKSKSGGKDLLSLLMRANVSPDLRPDQRLSDDEVLAQITTFMLAGSETTSTSASWGLLRLVENQHVQDKLRAEVCSVASDRPGLDELNALPYLDKVVHEILRYDGVVPATERTYIAKKTVMLPLTNPVMGRDGKMMDSVPVKTGTDFQIPIICVNRMKEFWGDDAESFNPDRFDVDGIPKAHLPGVYGNILTFMGGARNCIGYRFAVAELKVVLFMLLRSFKFEELPSKPVIADTAIIIMRPRVVGELNGAQQLPMLVSLVD